MIAKLSLVLPTLWRLGPAAVAHVAQYRAACRLGLYRRVMPVRQWDGDEEFFLPVRAASHPPRLASSSRGGILEKAEALLKGELAYFSDGRRKVGNPPDWFLDPFSGAALSDEGHWSLFNEFGSGDIKKVWEASRFEWAPLLARAWRVSADERYLIALNAWVADWVRRNPVNKGPNWKCGQEASIRLVNLLLAARLTGEDATPSAALLRLVALHCARILPTVGYALAQNNNHGTSEAAALFIGGAWLSAYGRKETDPAQAAQWRDAGRSLLDERVATLIAPDGSFSQYSVNYHRLLLDTLCQAELWRVRLNEKPFRERFSARCAAAVRWLAVMTDPVSGNAPNIGANDGARLYDLSCSSYRDFRPTVQLASVLFLGGRGYKSGEWDEPLHWLGLPAAPELPEHCGSVLHRDGGYVVLDSTGSRAVLRFARFRFRPGHADCLHLDLWHRGINVLRDGGTFSYNADGRWIDYFSGTESHNTVQFDGRNQMPRIGRFLFGDWLRMSECSPLRNEGGTLCWSGAYRDSKGARHRRTVRASGNSWQIIDEIGGFREKAVLRWRLAPGAWTLAGRTAASPFAEVRVSTTAQLRRLELLTGWESLYYLQKTELPVMEVEVGPGEWSITTEIRLKD